MIPGNWISYLFIWTRFAMLTNNSKILMAYNLTIYFPSTLYVIVYTGPSCEAVYLFPIIFPLARLVHYLYLDYCYFCDKRKRNSEPWAVS